MNLLLDWETVIKKCDSMSVSRSLPEGWIYTKIGQLYDAVGGGTPSTKIEKYWKGDIPWISSADIYGLKDIRPRKKITKQAIEDSATNLVKKGSIIVVTRVGLGKVALADIPLCFSQDCHALIGDDSIINTKYALYYLSQAVQIFKHESRGTTISGVTTKQLTGLDIPLPPINEQKRIVTKIDELFKESKITCEMLDKVPNILNRFRQSVLKAAYEGRLTREWRDRNPEVEASINLLKKIVENRRKKFDEENTKTKKKIQKPRKDYEISILGKHAAISTWTDVKLENLVYIAARIGWRGLKAEEYTETGPLFLSVYNLNNREFVDLTNVNHISMERYKESPEIQLEENDILLAKDGAGIGKIGIVKNLKEQATVNSSLLVIRSGEAFIPKYLFYFLSGPQMQSIVKTKITGSATPHLFQRDIKEFILSMPPLEEQREIVRQIESYFELSDQIAKSVEEAKKRADKIDQATLVKAFRGELVPQDTNDEPASVLLERIKQKETLRPEIKRIKKNRRK